MVELTKYWNSKQQKYTVVQIIIEMIKKAFLDSFILAVCSAEDNRFCLNACVFARQMEMTQ